MDFLSKPSGSGDIIGAFAWNQLCGPPPRAHTSAGVCAVIWSMLHTQFNHQSCHVALRSAVIYTISARKFESCCAEKIKRLAARHSAAAAGGAALVHLFIYQVCGRTQKNYWPPFVLGSRALNYRFQSTQRDNRRDERLEALGFCVCKTEATHFFTKRAKYLCIEPPRVKKANQYKCSVLV